MSQSEYNVEDILDAAVIELGTRLNDPKRREQMSDNVLSKFLDAANRAAERKAAKEADQKSQDDTYDPLEVILLSPLTPKRKRELIVLEIGRHQTEILRLEGALEGDDPDE